jgi:hypothetical protein
MLRRRFAAQNHEDSGGKTTKIILVSTLDKMTMPERRSEGQKVSLSETAVGGEAGHVGNGGRNRRETQWKGVGWALRVGVSGAGTGGEIRGACN